MSERDDAYSLTTEEGFAGHIVGKPISCRQNTGWSRRKKSSLKKAAVCGAGCERVDGKDDSPNFPICLRYRSRRNNDYVS